MNNTVPQGHTRPLRDFSPRRRIEKWKCRRALFSISGLGFSFQREVCLVYSSPLKLTVEWTVCLHNSYSLELPTHSLGCVNVPCVFMGEFALSLLRTDNRSIDPRFISRGFERTLSPFTTLPQISTITYTSPAMTPRRKTEQTIRYRLSKPQYEPSFWGKRYFGNVRMDEIFIKWPSFLPPNVLDCGLDLDSQFSELWKM